MLDWINKPSKGINFIAKIEILPCYRAFSSFLVDEIIGV
jgi:hypothetical protein